MGEVSSYFYIIISGIPFSVHFGYVDFFCAWQKKGKAKNEGDNMPESGGKQNDVPVPVVLKLDLHCEGCAKKIKRAVRKFNGITLTIQISIKRFPLTVYPLVN